jgi:hypothetical protein
MAGDGKSGGALVADGAGAAAERLLAFERIESRRTL